MTASQCPVSAPLNVGVFLDIGHITDQTSTDFVTIARMGLRVCRECKRQVSSRAKACPGCGAPPPGLSPLTVVVAILFGIVGVPCAFGIIAKASLPSSAGGPAGPKGSVPNRGLDWLVDAPNDKRNSVKEALSIFEKSCNAGLAANAEWARAKYATTNAIAAEDGRMLPGEFMLEELGWPDYVEIQIKIRDGAQGKFRGADGHVLWFWLGSGGKPGVRVSTKRWALAACSVRSRNGADPIKPIPSLRGVLGAPPDWWATWAERADAVQFPPRTKATLSLLGRSPSATKRVLGRESPESTGRIGSDEYLKWQPRGVEIDITYSNGVATEISFVFLRMARVDRRRDELSKWIGFDVKNPPCAKRRAVEATAGTNSLSLRLTDRPCGR
jgi:hypothetical protein